MRKLAVLQSILIIFFCSLHFVLTNSTGVDQNIVTSSKTSTNMSGEIEVLEDDYNNGNNILEPSIDINDDLVKDDLETFKQAIVNSPIETSEESKNVLNNDTPVILTLAESSTIELEKLVDAPLVSTSTNEKKIPNNISDQSRKNIDSIKTNITNFSSDITPQNKTDASEEFILSEINKNVSDEQKNEEIPSFSEWAQKRLEEVEKNEQINSSSKGHTINGKGTTAKLRWKNYASLDCGAKVIGANPESVSPGAILSPSSDEYKLNTCTSRIWFVVELCEAIQTKKIDLANYELFSSSPKDFVVSVSDRYPTRDWSIVGKFTAKDERDIQSFDLDTHIFGKYIKVEIKSHYGSEHYCPISLFRAYGTSVFEVLQKEDPGNINPTEDDDDDDDDDHILSLNGEHDESQKNLFSSATDAVMSIVKRAAEVLGNKVNNRTTQEQNGILNMSSSVNSCSSPSYMILCKNCSDIFLQQVYEIISCEFPYIKELVEIPLIYKTLSNSWICHRFGYKVDTILNPSKYVNSVAKYITSFFPFKYICAMCHEISILENKAVLNISQQFSNATGNITTEQIINLKVQEPHISNIERKPENLNGTESLNLSNFSSINEDNPKSDSDKNITYVSQIKPTKTLTSEVHISQTDVVLNDNASETILSPEKTVSTESSESVSSENFNESNLDTTTEIEGIETLEDHLEHLISDFNNENNQDSSQNVISTTSTTTTPQAQKESVFLRLSNRIKVLERNMSLSSQYLEELSRRYKKQVEEMQHLLEKTIVTLREEAQRKDLRNKQLEDRLDNLTAMMESLVTERHNWILSIYCLMTGTLVLLGIYFFCRKSTTCIDSTRENKETTEVLRRKSIDVVTHSVPVKKKRRPSDQALKIVRCSALSAEEDRHKSNNQRQRKRKKRNLMRSNSISNIKDNSYTSSSMKSDDEPAVDWIERNHQIIEDIPFALEECDHTTLEAYPLENELMRLNSTNETPTALSSRIKRISSQNNGSHNVSHEEISNSTEKNCLHDKINDNMGEPVKKEKRSFKKLFKKVF